MDFIDLPELRTARGNLRLPGSKSISNRVLLLAALAEGETEVRDLLASDDTDRMLEALQTLGVAISPLGGNAWRVGGVGGHFPNREAQLFLGNADGSLCSSERLMACQECEAVGLLFQQHLAQITMAKTYFTLISNGTGDTESLQSFADCCCCVSCSSAAFLDCDCRAYRVSPACIFKTNWLDTLNHSIYI